MTELESIIRKTAGECTEFAVSLGNTSLRVFSNGHGFGGHRFFARQAFLSNAAATDFEVWCIHDGDGSIASILSAYPACKSHRARAFAAGYFATDHFGKPVLLHQFGRRYYMVGVRLERPFWSFLIKAIIFYASLERKQLFLKGAAVVVKGVATLVVGRGGGGKTTLVQALCHHGASFVTNSHAVLEGDKIIGVLSTMRVRDIDHGVEVGYPALTLGERLVDPSDWFPNVTTEPLPLQRVMIVDYVPHREEGVRKLLPELALGFLDQFALGVNVYRLEEELLEHCEGDLVRFGRETSTLRKHLAELTDRLPCYVVRTDAQDPGKLKSLLTHLGNE